MVHEALFESMSNSRKRKRYDCLRGASEPRVWKHNTEVGIPHPKYEHDAFSSHTGSISPVTDHQLNKNFAQQSPYDTQEMQTPRGYQDNEQYGLPSCHLENRESSQNNSPFTRLPPDFTTTSLESIPGGPSDIDNDPGILDGESCWADDEPVMHDACFGVLQLDTLCLPGTIGLVESAPVQLVGVGDLTKLTFQESGKYAGFIKIPLIHQLLKDDKVQLIATLSSLKQMSLNTRRKQDAADSKDCMARIVVCGTKQDRSRIGKILSDAGLFLQHPSEEECGDLDYCNPHFLLRPGASLPIVKTHQKPETPLTVHMGVLNEMNKSRVMQIFDLAHNEGSQFTRTEHVLSERLKSALKDHQITALTVMAEKEWGNVGSWRIPSLWEETKLREPSKRYRNAITGVCTASPDITRGGILADDMGLGKTLTAIALICLSLDLRVSSDIDQQTLVVAPKSSEDYRTQSRDSSSPLVALPGWQSQLDKHVHYGQLRVALYHGSTRNLLAEQLRNQDIVLTTYETLRADSYSESSIFQNEWHRVILDEAHHIRNRLSQAFRAVCAIRSHHKWCLTGTPIHNSLDDYGALLSFLRVHPFAAKSDFDLWITKPIRNEKPEGFRRLQSLVRATCLRRTKESIGSSFDLPPRSETTELIQLHKVDQEVYDFFKERTMKLATGSSSELAQASSDGLKDGNILSSLNFLRLICCHGERLLPESALKLWQSRDQIIVERNGGIELAVDAGERPGFSAKIEALIKNLQLAHGRNDHRALVTPNKSIVFSYWTKMLDLIQEALHLHGFRFCRIDGSTSLEERRNALNRFSEDTDCTVMLASIGSAGEGLDLTAANHVHLMEPHWSPMAEAQAVDRVYRIGQVREVFVTRYIVPNSIETYIQWIQEQKLRLVSHFANTEDTTQAQIDMERWKQLRINLGCVS